MADATQSPPGIPHLTRPAFELVTICARCHLVLDRFEPPTIGNRWWGEAVMWGHLAQRAHDPDCTGRPSRSPAPRTADT